MTREEYNKLEQTLAEIMEPEAWKEYQIGNGICSNQAGWKCLESLAHAKACILFLEKEGLDTMQLTRGTKRCQVNR